MAYVSIPMAIIVIEINENIQNIQKKVRIEK